VQIGRLPRRCQRTEPTFEHFLHTHDTRSHICGPVSKEMTHECGLTILEQPQVVGVEEVDQHSASYSARVRSRSSRRDRSSSSSHTRCMYSSESEGGFTGDEGVLPNPGNRTGTRRPARNHSLSLAVAAVIASARPAAVTVNSGIPHGCAMNRPGPSSRTIM